MGADGGRWFMWQNLNYMVQRGDHPEVSACTQVLLTPYSGVSVGC